MCLYPTLAVGTFFCNSQFLCQLHNYKFAPVTFLEWIQLNEPCFSILQTYYLRNPSTIFTLAWQIIGFLRTKDCD